MARRFDQLFDSMSDVRSELKAEAKALFKHLYNTLRRTVRTNQQLANSLKVYCRMLQTQFPCSYQELTRPFADCIAQLTELASSLDTSKPSSLRQVVHRLRWGRWYALLSRPPCPLA